MTTKTFHIFKAGTHTTMAGQKLTFTSADMHDAAAAYSSAVRPAPLTINHPQNDVPVLGWIKGLITKGSDVYATAEFSEKLVQDVKAKRFTGVSAKWFVPNDPRNPTPGKWYLQHVGFLDGFKPSIKDLEAVAFAEYTVNAGALHCVGDLEAAFAEAREQGGDSEIQARAALHAMAQILVRRNPGMSYAAAAHTAHTEIEGYRARHTEDSGMDPDRVAFHESILAHQAAVPGMTYTAAAHQLMKSR